METKDYHLYTTLKNYYDLLSKTGYCSIEAAKKIIVLDFINSFINHYSIYITEEDLRLLNKAIECCNKDCPIDYPIISDNTLCKIYKETDLTFNIDIMYRLTENNDLRILEKNNYRIQE